MQFADPGRRQAKAIFYLLRFVFWLWPDLRACVRDRAPRGTARFDYLFPPRKSHV